MGLVFPLRIPLVDVAVEGQVAVEVIARRIATKVILLAAAKLTERVHENVDRILAAGPVVKMMLDDRPRMPGGHFVSGGDVDCFGIVLQEIPRPVARPEPAPLSRIGRIVNQIANHARTGPFVFVERAVDDRCFSDERNRNDRIAFGFLK
mgnify:CR=1 FL=1